MGTNFDVITFISKYLHFKKAWSSQCGWNFQNSNHIYSGLNISTRQRIMSGKKSSYVRQKLHHNGRSCPAWSYFFTIYRRLKTQMHLVSNGFSFYEHFHRQFTYAVFLIIKITIWVWEKHFIPILCRFFLPCLGQLLWKHFICYYVAL